MLNVFFTVDVEVWCDSWQDIDAKFPDAFARYVYGRTPNGDFGLPYKLKQLNEHGLPGVFFVEPLFASRFGIAPLAEIVGLIRDANQEVQMHLHTEWVDEAKTPLLPNVGEKRQHLRYFNVDEQTTLIAHGQRLLGEAAANKCNAFRAGSFAFNRSTLTALASNGIEFDSSYNPGAFGLDSGVAQGSVLYDPYECEGVIEYPMTVFDDGITPYRPAQLTACSSEEMEAMLWQALEDERSSFVILSHNFELLNQARDRSDAVTIKRFQRLCRFLDKNRDSFRVSGFRGLPIPSMRPQPKPLRSRRLRTARRVLEQVYRRRYG